MRPAPVTCAERRRPVCTLEQFLAMMRNGQIGAEDFERLVESVTVSGDVGVVMGRKFYTPTPQSGLARTYGAAPLNVDTPIFMSARPVPAVACAPCKRSDDEVRSVRSRRPQAAARTHFRRFRGSGTLFGSRHPFTGPCERYHAPQCLSISSSRSVIALLGIWIVSLCRSCSLKRAALISRSRMAARPTTLSPPSHPLPRATLGARISVRRKMLDDDGGALLVLLAASF
jgi:hypothetical protein